MICNSHMFHHTWYCYAWFTQMLWQMCGRVCFRFNISWCKLESSSQNGFEDHVTQLGSLVCLNSLCPRTVSQVYYKICHKHTTCINSMKKQIIWVFSQPKYRLKEGPVKPNICRREMKLSSMNLNRKKKMPLTNLCDQ